MCSQIPEVATQGWDKRILECATEILPKTPSYAQVVSTGQSLIRNVRRRSNNDQTIVFKPKANQTSQQIKELVEKLRVEKPNLKLRNIKALGKKIVQAQIPKSPHSPNIISSISQELSEVNATIERKRKPRIILFRLNHNTDGSCIAEQIYAHNSVVANNFTQDDFFDNIKFIRKTSPSNKHFSHQIFEISAKLRKCIAELPKLNIQAGSVSWDDSVYTNRCFNCQDFGHHATSCKKPSVCGSCGGSHNTKNCSGDTDRNCHLCKKFGYDSTHRIGSRFCFVEHQKRCALLKKVDFSTDTPHESQ